METTSGAAAEISPRRVRWGPVAWVGVLLAIGAVQLVRAQWFDAVVFVGVSAALAVGAVRSSGTRASGGPGVRWVWAAAAAVGALACAVPRHSPLMQALVCLVGAAALLLAWRRGSAPAEPWPRGLRRLGWAWGAIVILGCLWELAQFIIGLVHPQDPAYALSDLLDPLLATWPGRLAFIALWLAGGCFLVRRGRR